MATKNCRHKTSAKAEAEGPSYEVAIMSNGAFVSSKRTHCHRDPWTKAGRKSSNAKRLPHLASNPGGPTTLGLYLKSHLSDLGLRKDNTQLSRAAYRRIPHAKHIFCYCTFFWAFFRRFLSENPLEKVLSAAVETRSRIRKISCLQNSNSVQDRSKTPQFEASQERHDRWKRAGCR